MIEMDSVWDRTTGFLSDHLRAMLPIALAAVLLPVAFEIVIAGAAQGCDPAVGPIAAAIVSVVVALVTIWAQLALVAFALSPDRAAATRRATGAFGRAVGAMLLVFALFVVLAIPLVVAAAHGGMATVHGGCGAAAADAGARVGWFVPLYGIALALVAVFVSVRLTMLYPVIVAEGGVVAAIRRAVALSRGMFWRLFGVWLVFLVVYGIAALATKTALGAVLRLLAPDAGPFGVTTILLALLVAGVRVAFTLVVATFTAQLYRAATGAVAPAAGATDAPSAA